MTDDPLSQLVIDEDHLARELLATTLQPYLRLNGTGEVILEARAEHLQAADRILVVLLGLRAAHLLGLRSSWGATPTQLAHLAGMPTGTVRPKLSALSKERLVSKDGHEYLVPAAVVRLVAARLDHPNHRPRR